MLQVAPGRRVAAALAVAASLIIHERAAAQTVPQVPVAAAPAVEEAPLDPSAPLAPLPDLGVDWPTIETQSDTSISQTVDTTIADTTTEHSYEVHLEGLETVEVPDLEEQFRSLSTLEQNRKESANAAQIDRRAREDAELLTELLRANGFYDAVVDTDVQAAQAGGRIQVTLRAEPGDLYRFSEVQLPGVDAAGEKAAVLRDALGIKPQDPVNSANVIKGEAQLRLALGNNGFAFADVGALDITVDHDNHSATLVLPVKPNGVREFGRIVVEGTPLFSARHIQTIARFKPGRQFDQARLDDLRRALIQTGLVGSADVRAVERPNSNIVDVAVRLERAPVHTIAGEAGYGTGEGIRVEASWQHRNLIQPEGAVTIRGIAGTQEQLLGAQLRMNNFMRRDQVFNAQIAASHLDQPAFEARTFQISGNIERQTNLIWQKKWTWSVGTELIATNETDVDTDTGTTRRRTFLIAALPGTLSYDGSNDLLDPTRGFRLAGRVSPELSLHKGAFAYTRVQLDASFYQPVSSKIVIAGRTRLGTIVGAQRDSIAPSRRFYAGGGGSVRGFGYQDLGPRDPVFKDPIGGRSLAEFAIEARVRMGNFGIVPFLDAGNIYTSPLPDISKLRFGTGIGLRYHTNFGPIRLDVGTPIHRRSGEPRIAVYISLGQAF